MSDTPERRSSPRGVEGRILRVGPKLLGRATTEPIEFTAENPLIFKYVQQLPYLVEGEKRIKPDPRSGEIWISSWRHPGEMEIETGEQVVVAQRGKSPQKQALLRWSKYTDIYTAIRGATHVLERYQRGGEEIENTHQVVKHIRELLSQVRRGGLSRDDADRLVGETQVVLANAGFLTAEKPAKIAIAGQVLKGAAVTDGLGRTNPLIARTRLVSAWVKGTDELLFAKRVREKYGRVVILLEREQAVEQFYLTQVRDFMVEIYKMLPKSDEFWNALPVLQNFITQVLTPEMMKTNPYRKPALYTRAYLFGVPWYWHKSLLPELFGQDAAKKLHEQKPIQDMLNRSPKDPSIRSQIKERLRECVGVIDLALTPPQD